MTDDIKLSIAVIVGTIVLLASIVGIIQLLDKSSPTDTSDISGAQIHTKGNPDAKNKIVEFSDFECPACSAADPQLEKLLTSYPNDVYLEYRHFPLTIHPNSRDAAYAAEAAGEQGKFWEVHDWLFKNQSVWADASVDANYFYNQFGEKFGLDKDKFTKDYESPDIRERVASDTSAASKLRLDSTPTLFINGEKYEGAVPYEKLVEMLGLGEIPTATVTPNVSPTENEASPTISLAPQN